MPYVPPHLRNRDANGAGGGGKSLSDLANGGRPRDSRDGRDSRGGGGDARYSRDGARGGGGDARYGRDGRDDARGGGGNGRYSRESRGGGSGDARYSRDDVRGGGGQDTRYSRDGPRGGGDARNGSGDARYSRDDARNGQDARFSKDDVRSSGPVCPPVQDVRYAADDVRSGGGVVAEADQVPGGRWGRNPGRGPRCMCDAPHAQGHIYWPVEHSLERGEAARRGRTSLLGTHGQLCAGFFHTDRSDEAENNVLCLHPSFSPRDFTSAAQLHGPADPDGPCSRKPNVVVIARLLDAAGAEVHVARFTNCYRGYTNSLHSEDFMIADGMLRKHLDTAAAGTRLVLYMTQQPCHLSSGRVENKQATGQTSCTTKVINWQRELEFGRRGISLDLKLSRIFRAHWYDDTVHKDGEELEVFGGRAAMARDGLRQLLAAPRTTVSMLDLDDWAFLVSQADAAVADRHEWYEHVPENCPEGWWEIEDPVARSDGFCAGWVKHDSAPYASRVAADVFFERFLQRLRKSVERPVIAAPRVRPGADGAPPSVELRLFVDDAAERGADGEAISRGREGRAGRSWASGFTPLTRVAQGEPQK